MNARAEKMQKNIMEKFRDPERHAFIDSFESGRRKITRQAELVRPLALGLLDGDRKKAVQERLEKAVEHYRFRTDGKKQLTPENICSEGSGHKIYFIGQWQYA